MTRNFRAGDSGTEALSICGARGREAASFRSEVEVLRSSNEARLSVWFSTAISTRMPAHTHDAFEINLLVAGALRYRVEGHVVEVAAGECLLLPVGSVHELLTASADSAFWVLEGRQLGVSVDGAPVEGTRARVVPLADEDMRELGRLARDLWLRPDASEAEGIALRLEERLARLTSGSPTRRASHTGVRRARALAETVGDSPLGVAELAREAGLSASRLAHLFQDEVGVSPLQYLNYSRVQAFVRRWDGEQRTLLAAALAAGFGSYAKFHRVFSQVCGSSPREHRRFLRDRAIDPSRQLGALVGSAEPVRDFASSFSS